MPDYQHVHESKEQEEDTGSMMKNSTNTIDDYGNGNDNGNVNIIIDEEEDVEKVVANELKELNLQQREMVYEQLHGVDPVLDQIHNADELMKKLKELDDEIIKQLPTSKRWYFANTKKDEYIYGGYNSAYEWATHINPKYVRDMKLVFLRSDHFHPKKAARRMLKYYQEKLDMFGQDALCRSLTMKDDLTDKDKICLRHGDIQILPERDRSGRAVFCDIQNLGQDDEKELKDNKVTIENVLRAFVYLVCAAAEDEETQKRGIVCCIYLLDPSQIMGAYDRERYVKIPEILEWLPVKHVAVHFVFDNPALRRVMNVMMLAAGNEARARLRVHCGSYTESLYSLMTFGIPVHLLPITSGGVLKVDQHKKWMSKRKSKEEFLAKQRKHLLSMSSAKNKNKAGAATGPAGKGKKGKKGTTAAGGGGAAAASAGTTEGFMGIDIPLRNDVLLGRGKPMREHTGNVRMRSLVDTFRPEYDNPSASAAEKQRIALKVVQSIKSDGGGRFLKVHPTHGWWIEADTDEAVKKVGQAFRTARSVAGSTSPSTLMKNTLSQQQQEQSNIANRGSNKRVKKQGGTGTTTTNTTTTAAIGDNSTTTTKTRSPSTTIPRATTSPTTTTTTTTYSPFVSNTNTTMLFMNHDNGPPRHIQRFVQQQQQDGADVTMDDHQFAGCFDFCNVVPNYGGGVDGGTTNNNDLRRTSLLLQGHQQQLSLRSINSIRSVDSLDLNLILGGDDE